MSGGGAANGQGSQVFAVPWVEKYRPTVLDDVSGPNVGVSTLEKEEVGGGDKS